jgi:hypothetical protein
MKKARRYLALFLASVLSLSNAPAVTALADNGVTSLKVSVVGGGEVILDDYESEYTLESGDVFKANCTVDTKLKITVNSDEGNSINDIVVNGESTNSEAKGQDSYTYEYSVPVEGSDIVISFAKDVVEEKPQEQQQQQPVENPVTPQVENPGTESTPSTESQNKDEEVAEEEKQESENTEEKGVSEEAKKFIAEYEAGNYTSLEALEFRKSLVATHKLEDYVDESFFFKEEYLKDLEDTYLGDLLTLIRLSSNSITSTDELFDDYYKVDARYSLIPSLNRLGRTSFYSSTLLAMPRSVTVMRPNHTNISAPENTVSYYEGGYFMGRTGVYSVNGRAAFCADHSKTDPPSGTLLSSIQEVTNDTIRKILYYGSEGPDQISGWTYNSLRLGTAMAISNIRHGTTRTMGVRLTNAVSGLASPPSSFKAYIGTSGNSSYQSIAYWEYNPKGTLQISKSSADPSITNGNNCYDITGAVYGVYTGSNATGQVATLTIGSNGWSQEISLDAGTYYIKEITAPKGYYLDGSIYPITVTSGSKATKALTDKPKVDPISILLRKVDADTGNAVPQGNGSLANAEFTLKFYSGDYADGTNPADLGKSPTRTWVLKTDDKGFSHFKDDYKVSGDAFWYNNLGRPTMPSGTLVIQETKAPVGYKINPEVFIKKIVPGSTDNISTYNEPIIKEDSLDFTIKKVQEGTDILLQNVKFKHTKPDGTSEELTTNSQGEIVIKGLAQGTHKIVEIETIEGFEVNTNEFIFEVTSDNKIKVISNASSMGMTYIEGDGNGVLTVQNSLKPFQLKVVKVNDKNTPLKGAEFTLYSDRDCTTEIGRAVSDDNGELVFNDLKVETTYYFKETKAPAGYRIPVDANGKVHVYEVTSESQPSNGIFNFVVDGVKYSANSINGDIHIEGNKNDRVISIKVVNNITMKLPKTGSGAMIPMLVIGMALMGFVFVLDNKMRKKLKN